MPRPPRIIYDSAYYHIITRGIDRRKLFNEDQDYVFLLETIQKYIGKFPLNLMHYCLMPNHLHLLAQSIGGADLPEFMQGTLQSYANYFRRKYSSVGFVFQGRYKSRHIGTDSDLLDCGRYIERNPLRAGLVTDLYRYPWSSFLFYAKSMPNDMLKINPLYASLGLTDPQRQENYAKRVIEARPYEKILDKEFHIA
jgi:putative transposase